MERARAEIRKSCGGVMPPVYDPFSGGGSIPLEAQRLGLPAYGSDLNPVAVMIGKAMIEIPPKFKDMSPIHPGIKERQFYRGAEGLAEDVKYYGDWMHTKAWERIGHLYPQIDLPKDIGGGKATVIAWIWARTVPSPDPAFSDVHVPITSSFLLSAKPGKEAWIEPIVDRAASTIRYRIRSGGTKAEISQAREGTRLGTRANFRCLLSEAAITPDYIRRIGREGEIGSQLIAIVAEGRGARNYLPPDEGHAKVAESASPEWRPNLAFEPEALGFRVGNYGMKTFADMYTDRQTTALNTFSDLVIDVREQIVRDYGSAAVSEDDKPLRDVEDYANAVSVYLGFVISRFADLQNNLCQWRSDAAKQHVGHLFSRQAIPMTWDYAEANPFCNSAGSWEKCVLFVPKVLELLAAKPQGFLKQADAQNVVYPRDVVISTDPPYYDNIGYADLSDFFFVWLRRALKPIDDKLFSTLATPKSEELVATPVRHGGKDRAENFFLDGMGKAVNRMVEASSDAFPCTIYYAFKQSEIEAEGISSTGWATFLSAIISAGYQVVGTWPMRTELANRIRGIGSNALASSVVLVCRKKEIAAETITRAELIRDLKRELPQAIGKLQAANIAPADMPQSAIGPGMGVFSRYKAVLEADDSPMSVKAALQLINRELDDYLGGIQGEFDPETRFAITWFEQHGVNAGDYGAADNLARARGIAVESVKHAGVVESVAGKVRLLGRDELDDRWDPTEDRHLTIWECLQHLVKLHEENGIAFSTAALFKQIGNQADAVKDLAYCLYDIAANKRKDAKEATAYNALIADWTELSREAAAVRDVRGNGQGSFEL